MGPKHGFSFHNTDFVGVTLFFFAPFLTFVCVALIYFRQIKEKKELEDPKSVSLKVYNRDMVSSDSCGYVCPKYNKFKKNVTFKVSKGFNSWCRRYEILYQ